MGDETMTGGYPSVLAELLSTDQTTWKEAERVAVMGFTVEQMKKRIGQVRGGRTPPM
jgi:hypothetical protein